MIAVCTGNELRFPLIFPGDSLCRSFDISNHYWPSPSCSSSNCGIAISRKSTGDLSVPFKFSFLIFFSYFLYFLSGMMRNSRGRHGRTRPALFLLRKRPTFVFCVCCKDLVASAVRVIGVARRGGRPKQFIDLTSSWLRAEIRQEK
jgi:hypothetical protein